MKSGIEIKTIQKYSYMVYSSRTADVDAKAVILMSAETEFLGYLNFMVDGSVLPKAEKKYNLYYFYYHFSDMPVIVDMLRNEGPVYIFYLEDDKNNCRISTTMESVGEGEN